MEDIAFCTWTKKLLLIPRIYKLVLLVLLMLLSLQLVIHIYFFGGKSSYQSEQADLGIAPEKNVHPLDIDFYEHQQYMKANDVHSSHDPDALRKQVSLIVT